VRSILLIAASTALAAGAGAQDPREIVRKSVELDQVDWLRMKDYTWVARSTERHLDSRGNVRSENKQVWETLILDGQPYRRMLEKDGRPLPPAEQHKEQEKLDEIVAKLEHENPRQRQRRLDDYEKQRLKERQFLLEIPDAYNLRLEGEARIGGHEVWVISGTPKPAHRVKGRDAKPLLKIRGRIWIDKSNYQWVRVEAETTDTISFGLFLARLSPGAKLVFEQTRVNDEVWLPKRIYMRGAGRIGLLKRVAMEQEITWNDYRKFRVDSRIVSGRD
jgi:hypothetical protein